MRDLAAINIDTIWAVGAEENIAQDCVDALEDGTQLLKQLGFFNQLTEDEQGRWDAAITRGPITDNLIMVWNSLAFGFDGMSHYRAKSLRLFYVTRPNG